MSWPYSTNHLQISSGSAGFCDNSSKSLMPWNSESQRLNFSNSFWRPCRVSAFTVLDATSEVEDLISARFLSAADMGSMACTTESSEATQASTKKVWYFRNPWTKTTVISEATRTRPPSFRQPTIKGKSQVAKIQWQPQGEIQKQIQGGVQEKTLRWPRSKDEGSWRVKSKLGM